MVVLLSNSVVEEIEVGWKEEAVNRDGERKRGRDNERSRDIMDEMQMECMRTKDTLSYAVYVNMVNVSRKISWEVCLSAPPVG